jgi:hypothetical protein
MHEHVAALHQENPMGQPSSPASAAEHLESDRAPLTELIHLYRAEQETLIAHQQEVERRRAAVRTAAEQEAAEILVAARREIRRVVVRTRHQLIALSAQVQAAGCEASPGQPEPILDDQFQLSTARDVRSVLRDARAELVTLSRDVAGFWVSADEARLPAPVVATVPLPEPAAPAPLDFSSLSSVPARHTIDGREADDTEEIPRTSLAEKVIAYRGPAAVALGVLALLVTMIVVMRFSSRSDPAVITPQPPAAGSTASGPAAGPAAAIPPDASSAATAAPRTSAAPEQPASRPATTQPSQARPPEQTAPTGVVRGTTGKQAPPSVPVASRPAAAETQTAAQPNGAAMATQDAAAAEREILDRHQRWFDAFEHGDRATMASITSDNFSMVDQRPERAPIESGRVQGSIQDVRVRVTAGVGAVLSARIAETTAANAATVAMLSEVWIRQADQWRLVSVRMVPLAAVATTLQ